MPYIAVAFLLAVCALAVLLRGIWRNRVVGRPPVERPVILPRGIHDLVYDEGTRTYFFTYSNGHFAAEQYYARRGYGLALACRLSDGEEHTAVTLRLHQHLQHQGFIADMERAQRAELLAASKKGGA